MRRESPPTRAWSFARNLHDAIRRIGGGTGMKHHVALAVLMGPLVFLIVAFLPAQAAATPILLFTTGRPDGKIATASHPAGSGSLEAETADDFILGQSAVVTNATFTGLLPEGTPLSAIANVEIELYHVFPADSTSPPDGRVLTRTNSPSDNEFAAFDSGLGSLTFTASILNSSFTAANSVINGINALPNQFTGGEGAVTGEEVEFTITFTTPFLVGATDHDFFRPEVGLATADTFPFLWLSAPRPIVSPGTPQSPGAPPTDRQAWMRSDGPGGTGPDGSRVGTDITREG